MKKNLLLAIISGLLLWIAWPPTPYTTFLLFGALVPMLVAIENVIQSTYKQKGRLIFATTFIGFVVWNSLCIYWVYNSLKTIGPLVAIRSRLYPTHSARYSWPLPVGCTTISEQTLRVDGH